MKKYFFALVNVILLVPYTSFIRLRVNKIEKYFNEFGIEYDFFDLAKAINLELFISLISVLSLVGILFYSNKKSFYFISTFYGSIQLVLLFFTSSFSFAYGLMVLSVFSFLWFLIWGNVFKYYETKKIEKLTYLLIGVIICLPIVLYW